MQGHPCSAVLDAMERFLHGELLGAHLVPALIHPNFRPSVVVQIAGTLLAGCFRKFEQSRKREKGMICEIVKKRERHLIEIGPKLIAGLDELRSACLDGSLHIQNLL